MISCRSLSHFLLPTNHTFENMVLRESDQHLTTFITTFITPHGRWRYIRAPQGFLSSGDGYNRRFDATLSPFPLEERCVDDTCHYDTELEEHWWRTIDLLITLADASVVLNASKFQFCQCSVEFAGFRVGTSSIEPLPKYLNMIRDFPSPKNITDVRSWFRLVNQISIYGHLRDLMSPFKPFLSPRYPLSWTTELEALFQTSKAKIISAIREGVQILINK